jgi:hypothetical protein
VPSIPTDRHSDGNTRSGRDVRLWTTWRRFRGSRELPSRLHSIAIHFNQTDRWSRGDSVEVTIREYEEMVEKLATDLLSLGIRAKAYHVSLVRPQAL